MNIVVASRNPAKIDAVRELIPQYRAFKDDTIVIIERPVVTGHSNQPVSLEETIQGAMLRAAKAFENCTYSFGIEDGLTPIPHSRSGYMNFCVCSIYNGSRHHLGISPGFECPPHVVELITANRMEMSDAFHAVGMQGKKRLGDEQGAIRLLTNEKLPRKEYTKLAIMTALIQIEHSSLYP